MNKLFLPVRVEEGSNKVLEAEKRLQEERRRCVILEQQLEKLQMDPGRNTSAQKPPLRSKTGEVIYSSYLRLHPLSHLWGSWHQQRLDSYLSNLGKCLTLHTAIGTYSDQWTNTEGEILAPLNSEDFATDLSGTRTFAVRCFLGMTAYRKNSDVATVPTAVCHFCLRDSSEG